MCDALVPLSTLWSGAIPESLGELTNLKELSLSSNKLSGDSFLSPLDDHVWRQADDASKLVVECVSA